MLWYTQEQQKAHQWKLQILIVRAEVEAALDKLKTRKYLGIANITLEIINVTEKTGIPKRHELCQNIWATCLRPHDSTTSV